MDQDVAKAHGSPTMHMNSLDLVDTTEGSLLALGLVTHQTTPLEIN